MRSNENGSDSICLAGFATLAADPFGTHPFAKSFGGGNGRVRQGDWRALYRIDQERDEIVASRAEYEALVEAAEDAEDLAHLAAQEEHERTVGTEAARRDYLPGELVARMLAGEHPVRLWREQHGLKLGALAARSGIAASYLSEIESGRKPGSIAAFRKLAEALDLGIDDLVP